MTEPTDEELKRIWFETKGFEASLRALYQAGVASQTERIAELERMVKDAQDTRDEHEETINRKFLGEQSELVRLRAERDKLHAALGWASKEGVHINDYLIALDYEADVVDVIGPGGEAIAAALVRLHEREKGERR